MPQGRHEEGGGKRRSEGRGGGGRERKDRKSIDESAGIFNYISIKFSELIRGKLVRGLAETLYSNLSFWDQRGEKEVW